MRKIIILLLFVIFLSGCTKMQDKKTTDKDNTTNSTQMQKDPHSGMNMQKQDDKNSTPNMDNVPEGTKDAKAEELVNGANEFDKVYEKNKNESNKQKYIEKHMAAGIYLMYEANLSPKEKYGPALRHFNKILEVDPNNQEAKQNKDQIEYIYNQMGRPIPQ